MAINFRKIIDGIRIIPKAVSTASEKGDLEVDNATGKLNYHNGSSLSPVVTETQGASQLIVSANSASDAVRITQIGSGNALLVEDSASPDATPFVITATGLVGIGTESPNTNLQVIGQAFFGLDSNRVRLNSSAATGIIEFNSTEGKVSNNQAGGVLTFATSGGTERLRIDSSGNVGIGTSSPSARLHLSGNSSTLQLIDSYVSAAPDPAIAFRTARGTAASPTATQSGDSIGFIGARGYGATQFATGSRAYMAFLAAENWTDTAHGTNVVFRTTGIGSTTTTERLRIDSSGNVGIANTDPTTAGATNYRNLVIGSTGVANNGITIQSTTSGNGGVIFNDTNGTIQGSITYSHSIDELAFASGGSARLRIDSAGNVGINFNNPTARLVVADGANGQRIQVSGIADGIRLQSTFTSGIIGQFDIQAAGGSSVLTLGTNSTERLRIDSAGRLGIATTAPDARLEVVDTNSGGTVVVGRFRNDGTAAGTSARLSLMANTNAGAAISLASLNAIATNTAGGGDLTLSTSSPTGVHTERLRITSAGLVGINTTSPSSTNGGVDISSGGLSLVLGADASATSRTNATEKQARIAGFHYTNAEEPVGGMVVTSAVSSSTVFIGGGSSQTNAATSVQFYTAANTTTTTGTERLRIDSAGNVGIGTTSPHTRLHTNGPIATAVTSNGATSYNILATDSTVLLTATTGTITATLPTAVGITGRQYVIKRTGTGATSYTVNTTSSQTIDGATTYTLAAQYATVTVQSDGANWVIISKF